MEYQNSVFTRVTTDMIVRIVQIFGHSNTFLGTKLGNYSIDSTISTSKCSNTFQLITNNPLHFK